MADIFDQATEHEEKERERSVKFRKPEAPAANGTCLNCGEELPEGRFCNADCRDDWQKRNK